MRILTVVATNFGSYAQVKLDVADQGLTLIQGTTGSGKSTICDLIPWVLFGKTAKGGSVSDIVPWGAKLATVGLIEFEINGKIYTLTRTRNPNDLCLSVDGTIIRGKDNTETQQLVIQHLGMDYNTYLLGSYYHESSPAAAFFTAKAAQRRAFMEQLVDLSLASDLKEYVAVERRELTDKRSSLQAEISETDKQLQYLKKQSTLNSQRDRAWQLETKVKIETLKAKSRSFESDKANEIAKLEASLNNRLQIIKIAEDKASSITTLSARVKELKEHAEACPTCGNSLNVSTVQEVQEELSAALHARASCNGHIEVVETLTYQIERVRSSVNDYLEQAEALKASTSPYAVDDNTELIADITTEQFQKINAVNQLNTDILDLELLDSCIAEYRTITIENTINQQQDHTNKLLSEYFDGELSVKFTPADDDKVDVIIFKDGNECVYSQLSKGQRQLLKFCFSISTMRTIVHHSGVQYNALFLDEAFDGFDENLKVKAFGLLTALAAVHESVYVVEHSQELKSRFNKKYSVSLTNGVSTINEEA